MALELRREPAAGVPRPDNAHESFFVDENGQPALKNSDGVIRLAVSLDGDPLLLQKQSSPPPAVTDAGRIYAKDVSGVTELFYRDDSGNGGKETQVTSDGAVSSAVPGTQFTGTQFVDIAVNAPDGGPTAYNTGLIFPILGDNQLTTIHFRLEAMTNLAGTSDVGDGGFLVEWGTAITLPEADLGTAGANVLTDIYGGDGWGDNFVPFMSGAGAFSLNGAGELIITINNGKGDTYAGTMRVGITPGSLLSFDPTA